MRTSTRIGNHGKHIWRFVFSCFCEASEYCYWEWVLDSCNSPACDKDNRNATTNKSTTPPPVTPSQAKKTSVSSAGPKGKKIASSPPPPPVEKKTPKSSSAAQNKEVKEPKSTKKSKVRGFNYCFLGFVGFKLDVVIFVEEGRGPLNSEGPRTRFRLYCTSHR